MRTIHSADFAPASPPPPRQRSRRALQGALALSVVTAAISIARPADASGYLTARFGADHGTPAMPNTYAVYFNPAALGGTRGTTITGDGTVLLRYVSYERTTDALSPSPNNRERLLADPTYVAANTGKAKLTNVLALPFLGITTDLGTQNFRLGYAAYVPFGGIASWNKTDGTPGVPGSTDGPQRWQIISGQILAFYNTFAVAYVLGNSGVSIGASVSPAIHRVATVQARTADDSDEITSPTGTLKEGRSLLEVSGVNVAASAGVYWQSPNQRIRVGLAYLSQPGFGQTRLSGNLTGRAAGGVDIEQKVDLLQTYPDIIRLGGTYRLPNDKVELRSDFEFVRWSVFDKQCVVLEGRDCKVNPDGSAQDADGSIILNVRRNWNNAIGYRLGVGYFATDKLEIFGGAAFTTSAVPKETIDARTIDAFRLYGTVGGKYEFSRHFALAASYNHIYFFPVDTKGANVGNELSPPTRSPSADGKYNSQIGFLNVNVHYTF